jgi:hypothetical protein
MLREKRLLRGEITAIQGNVVDSGRVHKVCSQDANIAPKDNRPINRRRVAPTAAGHRPAECRRFGKYYSDTLSQFWTGDRGPKNAACGSLPGSTLPSAKSPDFQSGDDAFFSNPYRCSPILEAPPARLQSFKAR